MKQNKTHELAAETTMEEISDADLGAVAGGFGWNDVKSGLKSVGRYLMKPAKTYDFGTGRWK